jgi:hypothetical protein
VCILYDSFSLALSLSLAFSVSFPTSPFPCSKKNLFVVTESNWIKVGSARLTILSLLFSFPSALFFVSLFFVVDILFLSSSLKTKKNFVDMLLLFLIHTNSKKVNHTHTKLPYWVGEFIFHNTKEFIRHRDVVHLPVPWHVEFLGETTSQQSQSHVLKHVSSGILRIGHHFV